MKFTRPVGVGANDWNRVKYFAYGKVRSRACRCIRIELRRKRSPHTTAAHPTITSPMLRNALTRVLYSRFDMMPHMTAVATIATKPMNTLSGMANRQPTCRMTSMQMIPISTDGDRPTPANMKSIVMANALSALKGTVRYPEVPVRAILLPCSSRKSGSATRRRSSPPSSAPCVKPSPPTAPSTRWPAGPSRQVATGTSTAVQHPITPGLYQEPEIRRPADVQNERPSPTPDRIDPNLPVGHPESERRSPRQPNDPLVTTDLQAVHNLSDTIRQLRLIGQAQRTFILADGPDGLYVPDQHAAHERVIFDSVFRQRTSQPANSQKLMLPERATLDEFQHDTLIQNLELIEQQGFEPQPLNDLCWQINALPLPLTAPHCPRPEHILQQLLDEFAAEQVVSSPQQAVAATIACHSATRAGDVLGVNQMQSIIEQLAETPEPHCCPHGRPTIVQISTLRLEQEFRRR